MKTFPMLVALALAAGACATAGSAAGPSTAATPSPAASADTGAVRELGAVEHQPVLLNANTVQQSLATHYPAALRDAHVEGSVLIRLVVDVNGRPTRIVVTQPSARSEFDEAAVAVIRSMRFSPATVRGHAVPVFVTVPVNFSITR